jgi:hypothetical protein
LQIRYPINNRTPRGVNNRFRVGAAPGILAGAFNQKGTQRFVAKPKKPKQKKETKKTEENGEETEKKSILKDEDNEEEKQENG